MEKEMGMLLDSAGLFEVNVPDFKQLKQCRKEIKLLKQLWDYVVIVRWVAGGINRLFYVFCFKLNFLQRKCVPARCICFRVECKILTLTTHPFFNPICMAKDFAKAT